MKVKFENSILKNGVSGIMRVKNDALFIEYSIDSCIDALDELIIVHHECTDSTPELIEKKRKQYPDKIRVWEYKHKIFSINLSKEEYEYAKSLPEDSPNLLCNYYNFALSKCSYQYAMKIDADQIYFTERLKEWTDVYRYRDYKFDLSCVIGQCYIKILKLTKMANRLIKIFGRRFYNITYKCYENYLKWRISSEEISIILSGCNVFCEKDDWYVTTGKILPQTTILAPYNGNGDHLIFKLTPHCYYKVLDDPLYTTMRSDNYTLIEEFRHTSKMKYLGGMWFHLNSMRDNVYPKISSVFRGGGLNIL